MGMDQTVEVQTRIARALPQPNTDNQAIDVPLRGGRYGDVKTETLTYWRHLLADEGTYFTCNDAQTGLATAATPTAFSDTNPFLIIINRDNPGGRRVYIDLMKLVCTAIGTAGATVQFAVQLDSYPSRMIGATIGGTDLTANIVSPNFDMAVKSVVEIHAGNLAPNAKSSMNRVVEGQIYMKNAIPVVGDTFSLIPGDDPILSLTLANLMTYASIGINPLVIGPQQCALLHLWLGSQSGASSYSPCINWFEK